MQPAGGAERRAQSADDDFGIKTILPGHGLRNVLSLLWFAGFPAASDNDSCYHYVICSENYVIIKLGCQSRRR